MPDFMGQDRGQHLLVLAALEQALADEDEAAGRGQGVDLVRVQDEEMITGVDLRPVRDVDDRLAQRVDVTCSGPGCHRPGIGRGRGRRHCARCSIPPPR